MDKILTAWSIRDLQTARNVWLQLISHDKDLADLEGYLETHKKLLTQSREQSSILFPLCPECNTQMTLQALEKDDCHWTCPTCRFGRYVPHTVDEELRLLRIGKL